MLFEALKNQMKTDDVFLYSAMFIAALVPVIIGTGAYRIPNIYFLPRIVVWSNICKYINQKIINDRLAVYLTNIAISFCVFGYLIFKMIRIAESAGIMPYVNILFE